MGARPFARLDDAPKLKYLIKPKVCALGKRKNNMPKEATAATADQFADLQEVKTESLSFNKLNDWVRGTLTRSELTKDNFNPGKMTRLYEFIAQGGVMHGKDGKEIEIVAGAFYSFFGKPQMDAGMRNVRPGYIFGIQFVKTKPSTKGNDQKLFKVLVGPRDESYMGETASDVQAVFPGAEEVE